MNWFLIAQALASCWMCGLIWFVQIVHYPMFAQVTGDPSRDYAAEHQRRTTLVVGPPMLVEMAAAVLIVLFTPAHVPVWLAWTGVGLVAGLWVSTAAIQIPLHARLARDGHSESVIRPLVRTNWARTVMWSARALVSLWMLAGR